MELIDYFTGEHLIGITGALLILFGFYRTSIGQWTSKSFWYEIDNLAGALLMGLHEFLIEAYIPMVLSVVWAIVAVKGLSSYADRYEAHHGKRKKAHR